MRMSSATAQCDDLNVAHPDTKGTKSSVKG